MSFNGERSGEDTPRRWRLSAAALKSAPLSKWFGALLGLAVGGYLWFATPDIGLEPSGTKLLGLISLTLIFWVFRTLPDYGVALVFAMIVILTKLESAPTVMGGFASTTWFMTLGVLGLGAAITGCGSILSLVAPSGAALPAEFSLADHRHRYHGRGGHGADPAADRAHRDHQPNAGQSVRKSRLQNAVEGIHRTYSSRAFSAWANWDFYF